MLNGEYTLFVHDDPKSPIAESMRILRTNLQYVTATGPLDTLLITSPSPSEGKTLMSSNLAATYALAGVSTIVVGVDLRKPTIHRVFNRSNTVGVTSVLVGQATLDEAIVDTDVAGLRLLPAGPVPPNPAELLGSKAMRNMIAQLTERADMVIFDAPPVLAVTDASLLATMVAGTLLIVDISRTNREMAKRAKEQLDQVRANVVGLVANRIDSKASEYYYYYEYYRQEDRDVLRNGARPVSNASGLLQRLTGVKHGR